MIYFPVSPWGSERFLGSPGMMYFPFLNEELFGTPESLKPKGSLGYTFFDCWK